MNHLFVRLTFLAFGIVTNPLWAQNYPILGEKTQAIVLRDLSRIEQPLFSLEKWANSHSQSNLHQLIASLPGEFHIDPIWVYRSRSSQYASPLEPRIILKNKSGNTLLAFETRQSGANQVEFIQYDQNVGQYIFGVIEKKQEGWKFDRSEATQKFCASCHTASDSAQPNLMTLRPNFSQYNVWEGMFGSRVHLNSGEINEKFVAQETELLHRAVRSQKQWTEMFLFTHESGLPTQSMLNFQTSKLWERMVKANENFTSELHSQTYHRMSSFIRQKVAEKNKFSKALESLVLRYAIDEADFSGLDWSKEKFNERVASVLARYKHSFFESSYNQRIRNVNFLALELSRLGISFDVEEQKEYFHKKKERSQSVLDYDRSLDLLYRARLQVFLEQAYGFSLESLSPSRDSDQVNMASPFEFSIKNTLPLYFAKINSQASNCSSPFRSKD